MKSITLPLIAVLALTFGIISVVRSQPKQQTTIPISPPPISPYSHTVAAVGLVETSTENIAIGTPLSQVVSDVFVTAGREVKKGDPLFQLDTRQLRSDLHSREAQVRVAEGERKVREAMLNDADREFAFVESLANTRAISLEEVTKRKSARETAQAGLQAAEAQLDAARAEVQQTQTEIERSTVRAPIDGS